MSVNTFLWVLVAIYGLAILCNPRDLSRGFAAPVSQGARVFAILVAIGMLVWVFLLLAGVAR